MYYLTIKLKLSILFKVDRVNADFLNQSTGKTDVALRSPYAQ